jgi:CBS domain-containing protein
MDNLKLRDVVQAKNLLSVNSHQTTEEVLQILNKNKITAVPVLEGKKVLGIVDTLDILAFLVETCCKPLTDPGSAYESGALNSDDLLMIQRRTKEFKMHQVMDLLGNARSRNTFIALNEDTSLLKAMDHFKQGIHRIALINSAGNYIGIFSQIDFIDFLLKNPDKVIPGFKGDYDLLNINVGEKEVVSAPLTITAFEGFYLMHKKGVSSLAVVGQFGQLIGVLSASDLKFEVGKDLRILNSKIQEYLNLVHAENGKPLDYLMSVNQKARVKDVLQIISKERIHRVFICNDSGVPLQVASLTDLIKDIATPAVTEAF